VPAAVLALRPDELPAVEGVVLVPHAARAMAATETTATIFIDDLKALSPLMHHIRENAPGGALFVTLPAS
jgi:hypothetical protein